MMTTPAITMAHTATMVRNIRGGGKPPKEGPEGEGPKFGLLFRLGSFWVGAHWSPHNKRLCLNIIPCVTFWVVWPGGRAP